MASSPTMLWPAVQPCYGQQSDHTMARASCRPVPRPAAGEARRGQPARMRRGLRLGWMEGCSVSGWVWARGCVGERVGVGA